MGVVAVSRVFALVENITIGQRKKFIPQVIISASAWNICKLISPVKLVKLRSMQVINLESNCSFRAILTHISDMLAATPLRNKPR